MRSVFYLDKGLKVMTGLMDTITRRGGDIDCNLAGHVLNATALLGQDIDLVGNPLLGIDRQVVITNHQSSNRSKGCPKDHPSAAGELGTKLS
jgi:hypothetical protein